MIRIRIDTSVEFVPSLRTLTKLYFSHLIHALPVRQTAHQVIILQVISRAAWSLELIC